MSRVSAKFANFAAVPAAVVSSTISASVTVVVRWRDGVTCPCCRSNRAVRNGSYRAFQRYLCTDCDRTFNDKTGTIFAHSKVALRRWLFSIYAFLRFNTSLRQLQCEIEVTHKTIHRRIECFARGLDAPSLDLVSPVEIDEGIRTTRIDSSNNAPFQNQNIQNPYWRVRVRLIQLLCPL